MADQNNQGQSGVVSPWNPTGAIYAINQQGQNVNPGSQPQSLSPLKANPGESLQQYEARMSAVQGFTPQTPAPAAPKPKTPAVAPQTPAPQAPATPAPTAPATPPAPQTSQNQQYYYIQSQDATGKTITVYYDGNGNVLPTNPIGGDQFKDNPQATPNAGGSLVQLPSAPTQGGFQQNPQTPEQLNTQIQGQSQTQAAQLDQLNQQADQAFSQYESQIQQIQNGTFPLTPAQQSLYDSTKAQFDVLRQQQMIANQALVGGTQVAEARSGEAQYGAQTALGNVGAAINTGIQKLAALDSQGSKALADLQNGFQKDDLALIKDAYDAFTTYQTNKEKTLNDIYTATTTAEKDLRDFTYKTTQDNITNTLNSDKFTYQQKQDAIKNALDQAQLDETKRKALVDEAQKQEALNLQKAANDMIQGAYSNQQLNGIPQTLPNGSPNPKYQDTFLSTLSPIMQTTIKGIADYSVDPHSLTTSARQALGGLTQSQAIAMAKQYDPSYSEGQYAIRNSFMKNWQVGGQNSVIQAANTSIDHLTKLYDESQQLGNIPSGSLGPFTSKYNTVTQWLNEGAQNPAVARFKQDALALAGEQARIYKNGAGSSAAPGEDEIAAQLAILTNNLSPDTAKSLIQNGINLMTDRLTSATENYQSVMGKPPSSILYQTAQDNIAKLTGEGFTIETGKLNPSAYSNMSSDQFLSTIGGDLSSTPQSTSDFFGSMLQNAQSASQL